MTKKNKTVKKMETKPKPDNKDSSQSESNDFTSIEEKREMKEDVIIGGKTNITKGEVNIQAAEEMLIGRLEEGADLNDLIKQKSTALDKIFPDDESEEDKTQDMEEEGEASSDVLKDLPLELPEVPSSSEDAHATDMINKPNVHMIWTEAKETEPSRFEIQRRLAYDISAGLNEYLTDKLVLEENETHISIYFMNSSNELIHEKTGKPTNQETVVGVSIKEDSQAPNDTNKITNVEHHSTQSPNSESLNKITVIRISNNEKVTLDFNNFGLSETDFIAIMLSDNSVEGKFIRLCQESKYGESIYMLYNPDV